MKLIVVRHGETRANKKNICQGHRGYMLNLRGWRQAKKLAKRLKDEKIDVIYSSDLKRAVSTTKQIIKYHKKVPLHYVADLRERTFGEFEGKKWDHIAKEWERRKMIDPRHVPKGGETRRDVQRRIGKLFNKMEREHMGDTVLWVTHGGGIHKVLEIIEERTGRRPGVKKLKNASVTILEIDEDKRHHIRCINCVKHL